MIDIFYGDILAEPKPNSILVHGTNCQGVMGAGIAKQINKKFPEACLPYFKKSKDNYLRLGEYSVGYCADGFFSKIIHLNTQHINTRESRPCRYDAIAEGFERIQIEAELQLKQQKSEILFPLIGCGLGGGDWDIISIIIDKTLSDEYFKKSLWVLNKSLIPTQHNLYK